MFKRVKEIFSQRFKKEQKCKAKIIPINNDWDVDCGGIFKINHDAIRRFE